MFEHLDSIPWGQLSHAYGPAADAPRWIRALDSEDPDQRSEAIYHFLLSSAFHQYTLYSATPHVISFVIEALQDSTLSDRPVMEDGEPLMKEEMLCFLEACARVSRLTDDVGHAIATGRDVYADFIRDPSGRTREYAERSTSRDNWSWNSAVPARGTGGRPAVLDNHALRRTGRAERSL